MEMILEYESKNESDYEDYFSTAASPANSVATVELESEARPSRPVSKKTRAPNKRKRNPSNWVNPYDSLIKKSKFPHTSPFTRYVVGRFLNNNNIPATIWDLLPPEHASREECETNGDYRSFRDQLNLVNYEVRKKGLGVDPHEGCLQTGKHVFCSSGQTKEKTYWIDHGLVRELFPLF